MLLRLTHQPTLMIAKPSGPGDPYTVCPHCKEPLWLILSARPPMARPVEKTGTALVPKGNTKRLATTEIISKDAAGP